MQSPACPWEFYITSMLHERLANLDTDYDIVSLTLTRDVLCHKSNVNP